MIYIWIEIVKFLKNNKIKILVGTTIVTIFFVIASFLNTRNSFPDDEYAVEAEPATFRFFVEDQDGDVYTNNLLIEEYVMMPEVLERAGEVTNIDLISIIDELNEIPTSKTVLSGDDVLRITRNGNTGVQEFTVNIGNEEKNLILGEYFLEILTTSIPFLENKDIYILQDIELAESIEESIVIGSNLYIIKDIFLGLLLGITITLFILIINSFFSKKIKYSFTYSLRENDLYYMLDEKLNIDESFMEVFTDIDINKKTIIIDENNDIVNNKLASLIQGDFPYKQNTIMGFESTNEIKQIIYIIKEDSTTRNWYNSQRNIDRIYNYPTIVVQINKD